MVTKKRLIILAVIIIVIAVIAMVALQQQAPKAPMATVAPPAVTLAPVKYHIGEQTVKAFGTTISPNSMVVRAQNSAEIAAINFKAGQLVKKGQLLFRLKVSAIADQQQKLKAQMLESKSYYQRLQQMNQRVPGIVSSYDLLKAKTQYEQDLSAYQQLLKLENVKAAIAGQIADTNYAVGDVVAAGTELTQITDPSSLQVKYQLPSQYAKLLHRGQMVRFYPDGVNKVYQGKVSYIAPQFNGDSYSLTVRADLDNFAGLRPNHFGQVVHVLNPKYKTLVVPQGVVHNDAKGFYLYTVKANKVDQLYFQPGAIDKTGLIQVLSGVKANAMIINSDQSNLSAGQIVRVTS